MAGGGAATMKSLRSNQSSHPQVTVRVLEELLPLALQNSCVHWAADTGLSEVRGCACANAGRDLCCGCLPVGLSSTY